MKYKLNRGQLNELLALLIDLENDIKTAEHTSLSTNPSAWLIIHGYIIDQMNRLAGHKLAEQKADKLLHDIIKGEPTGWTAQELDEEKDGI